MFRASSIYQSDWSMVVESRGFNPELPCETASPAVVALVLIRRRKLGKNFHIALVNISQ